MLVVVVDGGDCLHDFMLVVGFLLMLKMTLMAKQDMKMATV